ncbi:protein translocase subunit SecF [Nanoarchaeota archaeon]
MGGKKAKRREKARLKALVKEHKTHERGSHSAHKHPHEAAHHGKHKPRIGSFGDWYNENYKLLLLLSTIILFLAIGQIGYQVASTGDFIQKGVSLKGGTTITIPTEKSVDKDALQEYLRREFLEADISVRLLTSATKVTGIIIDSDLEKKEDIDLLVEKLDAKIGEKENYDITTIGSSLGKSFFKETLRAVLMAFIFMAIVVFIYFRVPIPSAAIVLCALTDIITTIAIINILGMKVTAAGIAALLMLIGYSVDTDILLSTRVLKSEGNLSMNQKLFKAFKTGITMTLTTAVAVTVALIFVESDALKEIMTILLIGLIADIFYTWMQNAGIIRWYVENIMPRKKAKKQHTE